MLNPIAVVSDPIGKRKYHITIYDEIHENYLFSYYFPSISTNIFNEILY